MATIANQITRIQEARDLLRTKGKSLGLSVPNGTYWDDSTDTYKSYTSAVLTDTDQIDKIAAAFNTIQHFTSEIIEVPILLKKNGTTVVGTTKTLTPGYYVAANIKPYITVEEDSDFVIDVQSKSVELTTKQGTITPDGGFNYMDSLSYTIQDGAINTANAGYGNNYVTAKVKTSGWVNENATTNITVDTSTLKSKVGTNAETTISSGATINPNANNDTVITIGQGIYGSNRTLTVKSVASQTSATATSADILKDKTAWVNGEQVTGEMPNYGGASSDDTKNTNVNGIANIGGILAILPKLGYYNDYSNIITNIVYNPTRVFNTTSVSGATTETMTAQTYYETIPAGYYHTAITRKITVQACVGDVTIDYTNHKATFDVTKAGWIASDVTVDISAGPAVYATQTYDLEATTHCYTITPEKDNDGTSHSYLTQVTIDNTALFNLLAAI